MKKPGKINKFFIEYLLFFSERRQKTKKGKYLQGTEKNEQKIKKRKKKHLETPFLLIFLLYYNSSLCTLDTWTFLMLKN